jgi:transcriptional regulator with XRE-family HTH domain
MQRTKSRPPVVKASVATGRERSARGTHAIRPVRYGSRVSKQVGLPTFSAFLADAIARAKYVTPTDFARTAGVHPSAVSRWLSGQQVPTVRTLEKIAPFLQVNKNTLIAIAYPDGAEVPEDIPTGPAPHRLALELERLLAEDSPVPAMDRDTLERVIDSVLQPYRRHMKGQRRSA